MELMVLQSNKIYFPLSDVGVSCSMKFEGWVRRPTLSPYSLDKRWQVHTAVLQRWCRLKELSIFGEWPIVMYGRL